MTSLQQSLLRARLDLLDAQTNLALMRKVSAKSASPFNAASLAFGERRCERKVCAAIDRVRDLQCMANPSLQ